MSRELLTQYENELENLLIRIAGITDIVIKEQCQEEYDELLIKIICLREELNSEEKSKDQSNLIKYYRPIDFETFLKKIYGNECDAIFAKLRIRKPRNIRDHRYMQILSDMTSVGFKLTTLDGYDICEYNPKKRKETVYVVLNTFDKEDSTDQIMEHSGPRLGYTAVDKIDYAG